MPHTFTDIDREQAMATTTHRCPHCRCDPDPYNDSMGYVNKDAPFYPLVQLVDERNPHHDPQTDR